MANILWRNLHLCFSPKLIRCSSSPPSLPPPPDPENAAGRPTFFVNTSDFSSTISNDFDPDVAGSPEADFNAAFASPRFFFSSPGHSNSIFHSPMNSSPTTTTTATNTDSAISVNTATTTETADTAFSTSPVDMADATDAAATVSFAVKEHVYSADPYRDFKQSMEEMISALGEADASVHEEFLHDLLFSYLCLNPEHTHKFILRAFADTLVPLLLSPETRGEGFSGDC